MVRNLFFLLLLLPLFLFSAEFTASVSRNPVTVGESFTLNLTLKDASAQSPPALDALKKLFTVNSQQEFQSTVVKNGLVTSSFIWKISLTPLKEGELTIPAIIVKTTADILSSNAVKINVIKASESKSESSENIPITLTMGVSKSRPYKNEPVVYNAKLISKVDLANVRINKFDIEDAITEPNGEPKVSKEMVDGVIVNVIDLSYLITPLKPGILKIPSLIVQGSMPTKKKSGSFGDDDFESLFMMGFNRLQPFSIATEDTVIDVQPAIAGMNPWVPARSLVIEEIWDDTQALQTGEPITRGFKIVAEGIMSSQLPSLNDMQTGNSAFKIYADKAEVGDTINNGNIQSFRKEMYTLIPQQSGALTLPEISIAWWDVTKNEKVVTTVPAKKLQVLPRSEETTNTVAFVDEEKVNNLQLNDPVVYRDPILYVSLGGLGLLLFAAIVWGIILKNKIARLTKPKVAGKPKSKAIASAVQKAKKPVKDKKEKLPDLNPT